MKIENADNFIELDIEIESEKSLPSFGDAYVSIIVSSHGFSGRNQVWVQREELKSFCTSLVKLEKYRKGEATLNSISPGELKLRIYSVDSQGHLAIEGSTGYVVSSDLNEHNHSVSFGFSIEPNQLVKICKLEWVQKNA